MKLPRQYFDGLTASKYREYLKLLPSMQQENTRIVTTLILTFFAMSFFGIFAINPTLSTIVTLRKTMEDSTKVHEDLKTKISNLSALQLQYSALGPDLPTILDAIPSDPKAPTLMGQILSLSQQKRVKVLALETSAIQLTENNLVPAAGSAPNPQAPPGIMPPGVDPNSNIQAQPAPVENVPVQGTSSPSEADTPKEPFYRFSLQVQGTYEDLIDFANSLTQINRLVDVDTLSISRDSKQNVLILEVGGKAYFQK